ncbi:MAG: hypothetical protein R2939_09260 [Kofleriaceae bacterium]
MAPFRGNEGGDLLEAPVAGATLRLEIGPRSVTLILPTQRLIVAEGVLTLVTRGRRRERRESIKLPGPLWVARDVPHEDLAVWIAQDPRAVRVRRVMGVEPRPLIDEGGLDALRALDRLALRLRQALAAVLGPSPRAIELGRGLDKLLVVEHEDHTDCYQRPLFQGEAGRSLTVSADGRVVIHEGRPIELVVRSRYGITVLGDYLRFSDPSGLDLGRVSIPWIDREDRLELARRLGERVEPRPEAAHLAERGL